MSTCTACGADNPEGARFCNQCGSSLQTAATPAPVNYTPRHLAERILSTRGAMMGERKRVTVLFADIKGSSKLAQEAGAEQLHGILDRFFGLLSAAVHRYEGTVNQYTGDGIMALFGAPIAHEDHAQRACFAALEMQREVRRYADALRLQKGLNLSMRVGLNTGEVIVGRIGDDLRMDYTAQGLTVNLAARMEHICEPGRIYLSRHTQTLVQGYFRLRDLGPLRVDGLDAPVEVFELEGEGSLRTRLDRSLARGGSPFIGREPELQQLLAALERVRAGEGQVLAVIGNAGIGKSRLCHEFLEVCEGAGVEVHRATGVPYAGALPLYPVQQLTRSRLGVGERSGRDEVRRMVAGTFLLHDAQHAALLPALFDFLGVGDSPLAPEQAAEQRSRLFELLADYLPCSDNPQVLLIEDLHFLDAASEAFIARLCARVRGRRTLLLLNYRPEYLNEWLIPHLDEQIAVSALGPEQLERLASDWLGTHPSLKGVAQRIRERASGNPFFVEEAVQALADSGHLRGTRGDYQLARAISDWPVPDTVHALLAARMDRLPDAAKTLLQTAAVIGQHFDAGLLAEIAAQQEHSEILAFLTEAGFVHPRASDYAFCHPLMQEVAYHTQLETRRTGIHARLAKALEAVQPKGAPGPQSVAVAHHWQRAGEWEQAGTWNLQAARWAGARDIQEAQRQFRDARDNFDRAPLTQKSREGRIAARSGLIRMAQFLESPREEIERAYAEARVLADECGDIPCAAELMISYASELLRRGDAGAAVERVREAVALCIAHKAGHLVHRFRLAVLLVHYAAGQVREALECVDAAAGSSWRSEPIGEENYMSRGFYGLMLAWMGRLPEAWENLSSACAYADKEDRAASWMHANLVDYGLMSGEYRGVLAEARQAVQRAEAFGSPYFRALAARALAQALILQGDGAQAVAVLEPMRVHVVAGGLAHSFEASFLSTLSRAYLRAGRPVDALAAAHEGIASGQRSQSRVWELLCWLALMELPPEHLGPQARAEADARAEFLINQTGSEGFRPALWTLRLQAAADDARREECRLRQREAWLAIGAQGHLSRLSGA